MFVEGLTEALNQLGVVQEGLLSAIVDPSIPITHDFLVEGLEPARVCLADGELTVDLQRAVDRPPTPEAMAAPEPMPSFDDECDCEHPVVKNKKGYVPFGGAGYRLDGK